MNEYRQYYADGRWLDATSETELTLRNPTTEEPIARLLACGPSDVAQALEAARRTAPRWAQSSLDDRRRALQTLRAALARRTDGFVEALVEEVGVPVWTGRTMQVPMPLGNLDAMIDGLDRIVWEERIANSTVVREPVGVVAAITPWNFPLHQIVAKIGGAIGAGCAAVLKPSEIAPGVARLFMEAVADADLPAGLVNMVWGGVEVGERLVADPGVDLISFTGSTSVGRKVLAAAAPLLKRVVLELGGKSAALLLDDADLDAAIPAALRRCMVNTGQTCVAQSRMLVPRSQQAEVLRRIASVLPEWALGDPRHPDTRTGPVATAHQFDLVNRRIVDAVVEGAVLITGGPGRAPGFERGYFVAPTVFADVSSGMAIANEEVFGPVLAVMPYDTEDDGVALANATSYGLSGGVWSADERRVESVARRIRAGQVTVNGAAQNLAAPFGGFGHSGFGRENGRFGIEAFLDWKAMTGVAWQR